MRSFTKIQRLLSTHFSPNLRGTFGRGDSDISGGWMSLLPVWVVIRRLLQDDYESPCSFEPRRGQDVPSVRSVDRLETGGSGRGKVPDV